MTPWYRAEVTRKVLHVTSATIPLAYLLLNRDLMLGLLAALCVFSVVVEAARHASPAIQRLFSRTVGFMVRDSEWGRLTGSTYVLLGGLLTVWLFPKRVAVAVLLVQSISDAAASLIGINYGRSRFLGKSFAGSSAFFITALAILLLAFTDYKGAALLTALVATLIEALPSLKLGRFELNDNLMVPLGAGALICWLTPLDLLVG
jgi:dolichol kinase